MRILGRLRMYREAGPRRPPERLKRSPAPLFYAASRKVRPELYEGTSRFGECLFQGAVPQILS